MSRLEAKFLTGLSTYYVTDVLARLNTPLKYQSKVLDTLIIVPEGFITDFASVPRVPIVYSMWGDRAHHESLPHDYLYQTHKCSKALADKVFLEAMKVRNKPWHIRYPMYWGVVLGGRRAYNSGPERFKRNQGGSK